MFGVVLKYFNDRGYGFIKGDDGNRYYVKVNQIQDKYLESGYIVNFIDKVDNYGNYIAWNVIVVDAEKEERR